MSEEPKTVSTSMRYRPLGLLDNPFMGSATAREYALESAVAQEGNKFLKAIDVAAGEEKPRPICITKHPIPTSYPMRAVAGVERELVDDDDFNVLHAYIMFFMLHNGRIRSTLHIMAERLAFRSFDKTLVVYVLSLIHI